jgi:2',3'-cyclic-nucleotide 2'-phosphodiesterase (5'-nucleotidase family)
MRGVSFDDARARVTDALKQEGFGILTEIDVESTLKAKLDRPFRWEFAYGLARSDEIARRLPYPILAANYHGSSLELQPFTIVDRGGIRVAVIGLSAVVARHLLPRDQRSALEVTMGESELRTLIPCLRRDREVDLVLVLSHLGFPQDCKLAAAVPDLDVLLSGHTHNRLDAAVIVNDTLIMQSGAHGSFVGRLDLTVARDGVTDWAHALVPVNDSVEPDADMSALWPQLWGHSPTRAPPSLARRRAPSIGIRCSN